MNSSEHLSQQVLQQSLCGDAPEQEQDRILGHLETCEDCQTQLELLASGESGASRIVEVLQSELRTHRLTGVHDSRLFSPGKSTGRTVYPSDYAQAPADFAVTFLQPSERDDAIGRLDTFEVMSVIGCGGMGIVLKGFQEELNRPVAIKVLAPHLATSGAARQRFAREAQATAAIVHANVMPVLSVSSEASLPFLVMPFVACHSLQQRLDSDGALPVVDTLRIALQVAEGLAAAHAQGLVHRDVKPANILLERSVDRAMLTDFGLARAVDDATVTRSGVIAGTPQYMSPEQAQGAAIDARSDLFSLGSVIYTMCVGRPPFRADTSYGILRKITDIDPVSMRELMPETPAWLERLTGRLLEKDADDRFDSAEQVAGLIRQCLAHVSQPTAAKLPEVLVARENRASPFWRTLQLVAVTVLIITAVESSGLRQWLGRSEATAVVDDGSEFSDRQAESVVSVEPGPLVFTELLEGKDELARDIADLDGQCDLLLESLESGDDPVGLTIFSNEGSFQ